MKKRIAALALCLAAAQPLSASAYATRPANPSEVGKTEAALNGYSEESWAKLMDNTLEYGEIEDLVKNFNVNISAAWDKYRENVDNLNFAIDTLKAAKRELEGRAAAAVGERDIAKVMLYKAQGKGLGISMQAMGRSRDKLSKQITAANAPIRNAQDQVTAGVRALMIGYKNLETQEALLERMVQMYEETLRVSGQTKNLGMSTSADLVKAESDLLGARAKLSSLRASREKLYRTLITMCGWNPDASVIIGDIPELRADEIDALNPETDLRVAIGNNAALIQKRHDTSSKSTSFVDAKLYQAGQDEDMLRANLNQLYDKIREDQKALEAANAGNEAASATESALNTQRDLGMLSTAQYLGGKLNVLQKQAELSSAALELRTDYNTYRQALDGDAAIE